ncbi:MAG TPA: thiolase family protein [Candidatus Sulfotelmatobacter sp.]|nr:thiolase family protein [Candidatus Sulfotelmatobacter sp.]
MNPVLYDDVWLLGGARTPFVDYNGPVRDVSPTDLGIAAARAALEKTGTDPADVDHVIAASVAQASFDAYCFARHVGLYSGVPIEVPALQVMRVCGSGFETIVNAADALALGRASRALCVGAESMSRNPVVAYTHRGGFKMGQVQFADFLWEATLDTAPGIRMGDTAENLAKQYGLQREEVDAFAADSFARALAGQERGYFDDEVVPLRNATFARDGYEDRTLRLERGTESVARDTHPRPTDAATLGKLKPAFGGVQTGGNSSAIVDGAAGAIVVKGEQDGVLARVAGAVSFGVPPEIMGIGPVPASRAMVAKAGLDLGDIGRWEINEAFGAQILAVERELGIDHECLNVNGGGIAIGHPLAATGVRCTLTLARALRESGERWGIAGACAGGGQGVVILLENPAA